MNISYDHEVDALYIRFGDDCPEGVTEMSAGVNLDLTPEGKVVGIEISNASTKVNLQTIFKYQLDFDQRGFMKKAA